MITQEQAYRLRNLAALREVTLARFMLADDEGSRIADDIYRKTVDGFDALLDSLTEPETGGARVMNFGHHPDPATDFCVEVDIIESEITDQRAGLPARFDICERIAVALCFRTGGVGQSVAAKAYLRRLERVVAVKEPTE